MTTIEECRDLLDAQLSDIKRNTRNMDHLCDLFVTLARVRDRQGEFGERVLTYMMLSVWYKYFPVLAAHALETLILEGYGSWRDIKGLCRYLRDPSHPFFITAVELMIRHLQRRNALAAKWAPRENKKKAWLYDAFVYAYLGATTSEDKRRFRKLVANAKECRFPDRGVPLSTERYEAMRSRFASVTAR